MTSQDFMNRSFRSLSRLLILLVTWELLHLKDLQDGNARGAEDRLRLLTAWSVYINSG